MIPSPSDPLAKHHVVVRRSNIANSPKQIFVIGEGDDAYAIFDDESLAQFSNVASPADQEDLGWIKRLVDAIRTADEEDSVEAVGFNY